MPRPLRTRKQAPAAVPSAKLIVDVASTAVKPTKKNKPVAAAPTQGNTDHDSTFTTPKAKKLTRTRASAQASAEAPATVESKSRTRSTKAASTALPAKEAHASRTRSSVILSSQTTRATRRAVHVPATQSPITVAEEQEFREPTPSTIVPSTPARSFTHGPEQDEPEPSPTQSSNAENRSPRAFLALTSSPPIAQSTPKGNGRPVLLDFSSDAGYTLPPPSTEPKPVVSAERPRLRDLDAKTLEPVGILDGWDDNEEDDEGTLRLPSPSPKKLIGRPSDFLIAEEEYENDDIICVTPRAELQRPEAGVGFFVGDDSQEFMIYSDPSLPVEPPRNTTTFDDDDIMRPPESTDSSSPARKRRSSEAGMDEVAELAEVEPTPRSKRPRAAAVPATKKTTRSKTNGKMEMEQLKTDDLRSLLPQRKKTTKTKKGKQGAYDTHSSEEDEADDNDEVDILARRSGRTRKAAATKKTIPQKFTAKVAKTTVHRTSSKRPSRTYMRKSLDNSVNDPTIDGDDNGPSRHSVNSGDGVIKGEVKKELNEIKKKFEDVDKWDLEFEDVSVKSSDSGKR